MICEHCKKEFNEPLELYNGEWACPLCRGNVNISSADLEVTHKNDELFKLSEMCYFRAIKSENTKDYQRDLQRAVALCKEAARLQHPKALVRMGYYYEIGYIAFDKNEAFKMAHDYYKAVWTAGKVNVLYIVGEGANEYADNGKKIRARAANLYLNLLKNPPEKFAGNKNYGYAEAKAAVVAAGLTVEREEEAFSDREEDRAVRITEIFELCFSKERAPLFGVLRINGEEFKRLCEIKGEGKRETRAKLFRYAEKIDLVMLNESTGEPQAIKTEKNAALIRADEQYYLYFFNANGKHVFSGGNLKKVQKVLESGGYEFGKVYAIAEKAKSVKSDFVFYDDDVLKYKSKSETAGHATQDLINAVLK